MELKPYQKKALDDLSAYLDAVNETGDLVKAWTAFWNEKDISVGWEGVPYYQTQLPGTPHVCMKVPTGGGKTFMACSAVKRIFDRLPQNSPRMVIWLVPSEAILTQTIQTLSDPGHPYRQQLNKDFAGKVGVYTKDQLLNGQNFSPDTVRELLTVCVLSYASLRIESKKKDVRKVFQENGNLMRFAEYFRDKDVLMADTPDTALIQVLRALEPVVIVDESHNAGSILSVEMLQNLNPSMILELTATPRKTSNILCYVDARELKKESMVKLPVIVYNRASRESVIGDAIRLRMNLEKQAIAEQAAGGAYIRPIVLFQAQPNINEDSATFEKLKALLIESGIPEAEIAIKTSKINELGTTNLLSKDCPIRYIITVNALKEGWDCPFAYILASLANRSSKVEVEQILGRILRQPDARQHKAALLNTSFVLTSSKDFKDTLDNIVLALNRCGFSRKDYRAYEPESQDKEPIAIPPVPAVDNPPLLIRDDTASDPFGDVNPNSVRAIVSKPTETAIPENPQTEPDPFSIMISSAEKQVQDYQEIIDQQDKEDPQKGEINNMINHYKIQKRFRKEVKELLLPQFTVYRPFTLFGGDDLLEPEHLSEGFSLAGQNSVIDFERAGGDIYTIDIQNEGEAVPKFMKTRQMESDYIRKLLESKPAEERISFCVNQIVKKLNLNDRIEYSEIPVYVRRVIEGMSEDDLARMQTSIPSYAKKIQEKIEELETEYRAKVFREWLDIGKITMKEMFSFPEEISPADSFDNIPKSLYESEQKVNDFEWKVLNEIAAMDNVRWWHRNIERKEFRLNGPLNHYPDFIVMTESEKLVLVETKGDHLTNDNSRTKAELGRVWQSKAGEKYRYFMVFDRAKPDWDRAYTLDAFVKVMKEL